MKRLATLIAGGILVLSLSGCSVGGALFKVVFLRNGAPSGDEIRRMEEREGSMLRALPEVTILVMPVGMLTREGSSYRGGGLHTIGGHHGKHKRRRKPQKSGWHPRLFH